MCMRKCVLKDVRTDKRHDEIALSMSFSISLNFQYLFVNFVMCITTLNKVSKIIKLVKCCWSMAQSDFNF